MRRTALVAALVAGLVAGVGGHPASADTVEPVFLGTLPGGRTSSADDINEAGMIIGWSDAADGHQHVVRWDRHGTVTDLGDLTDLGGSPYSLLRINGRGAATTTIVTDSGERHAARWDGHGDGVDLGTMPGGRESWAYDINDDNIVVGHGYAMYPDGSRVLHALRWEESGRITDLGPGEAHSINNAGTTVGVAEGRAARWDARGNRTILDGLPGGHWSSGVYAINEAGVMVGYARAADGYDHAVRWDREGRVTDLGTLPGSPYSTGFRISENGLVAGIAAYTSEVSPPHAARWDRQGRITDLGTLPGDTHSSPVDINRHGVVVGQSCCKSLANGVWWDRQGRIHQLFGRDGERFPAVRAINDRNVAVGSSFGSAVLWRLP